MCLVSAVSRHKRSKAVASEMGQGQEHISQGCCRLSYSCCLGTRKTTATKQQMMFEARGDRVEHSGLDLIRSNPTFENQKRRPMA
jgi:hypothetical protein